jgi:SAM-dependent methyltransferase
VLDVGCACGGFAPIMRALNPAIQYTGVDVVPAMIEQARGRYPEHEFRLAAGHTMPFPDRSFDLVHCSGVVHLNSHYEKMIAEMWRVCAGRLLFDLRLTERESRTGSFKVDFGAVGTPGSLLPYNLINFADARNLIDGLPSPAARVDVAGYLHPASHTSSFGPNEQVIMAFVLMHRVAARPGWHIDIAGCASTNAA